VLAVLAVVSAALVGASSAGGANECEGLMVCVPVSGPWVVVPTSDTPPAPQVAYQLSCPRGYIVGGLDDRLSARAVDVGFMGALGSPVNPGITTSRTALFLASYAGASARAPTFKPFIGCMPATGGGSRLPTSAAVYPPGQPTTRRVKTVRVRPGSMTIRVRCRAGERLVGASHAFGFATRTPPSASLVGSISGEQEVTGREVAVRVTGDAELGGVRATVQVHAVCAGGR
jgi:hypothetical protein